MAQAQKEPSLLQRDLLADRLVGSDLTGLARRIPSLVQTDLPASKLVGADSDLLKTARPDSKLCNIAKCQLCEVANAGLGNIPAFLPEARLCDTARATRRVNAPSPLVDSKGQWASDEGAVSQWTPIATVQVLCTLP